MFLSSKPRLLRRYFSRSSLNVLDRLLYCCFFSFVCFFPASHDFFAATFLADRPLFKTGGLDTDFLAEAAAADAGGCSALVITTSSCSLFLFPPPGARASGFTKPVEMSCCGTQTSIVNNKSGKSF